MYSPVGLHLPTPRAAVVYRRCAERLSTLRWFQSYGSQRSSFGRMLVVSTHTLVQGFCRHRAAATIGVTTSHEPVYMTCTIQTFRQNTVLAPFAAAKGRTIKFLRRQEYAHGEVCEKVARVANLQVAVEKINAAVCKNPTRGGLRCI